MNNKPKIALINLGCSKNLVDSEIVLGFLNSAGYEVGIDEDNADIIIINTCSFIADAEEESVKVIMEQVANQEDKKIIVIGCLAQKHGQLLLDEIPELSAVVGTSDIKNIVNIVNNIVSDSLDNPCKVSSSLDYLQNEEDERFYITAGSSSYVKIAEGCDWRCTYCLIPDLKGSYRSRSIESIVKEVKSLVDNGTTEIILIAQDTTNYGSDLYGKPSLPLLIKELDKIEELKWLRLLYTYPKFIDDELINAIKMSDKVVRYLDIPLQHIHPDILRLMKRPNVDVESLLSKLRCNIPDLAIRTCFIVGFPSETEEHFEYLCSFVKSQKFDRVGVFEYSKEENTPAFNLKNHIDDEIKTRRRDTLMELQNSISLENHKLLLGKTIDVLLESIDESGQGEGRSYLDAPEIDGLVYIDSAASSDYLPGDIIPVKITNVTAYDLYGVVDIEST
ncbi:MAG: 30S ribosomal protein S12 methylthiotransferase RimO [Vampirovibrionia bacterium]